MVEWVAIAIFISVAVTGTLSTISIWHIRREGNRQARLNSMHTLKELDTMLKERRFKIVEAYIYGNSAAEPNDDLLERYLNNLDTYAVYWEEGLLTKKHITESYRGLLIKVRNNTHIQNFMKKKDIEYQRNLYRPLKNLCNSLDET